MNQPRKRSPLVDRLTAYSGAATGAEFKLPTDLAKLSDEEIETLHTDAVAAFDTLYGDGNVSGDVLGKLAPLTESIEKLAAEKASRAELASKNAADAAALAARVRGNEPAAPAEPTGETLATEATPDATVNGSAVVELAIEDLEALAGEDVVQEGDSLVASGKGGRKLQIMLPKGRNREHMQTAARQALAARQGKGAKDVITLRGEGLGFAKDSGVDFNELGMALDKRLQTFNSTQYEAAAARNQQMREIGTFAAIRKDIPAELTIQSTDRQHVMEVVTRATDERQLKGNSLVASGGWHAPSEILYNEFLELESRDGILSIPEIGVTRGGVQITPGPSFKEIYQDIRGFHFSEQEDIDGEYGVDSKGVGNGTAGTKPVYHVEPPEFTDYRLDIDGLIITSGLLGARGYPEHLARVIRGALVAHDHKINADVINKMALGSTAISLPTTQAGALAPVLTAIELQVEHYRDTYRMARGTTLEAVFPFWIRGAIRSDLSRRLGVDLIDVNDARIAQWFAERGVAPQFVYDWQSPSETLETSFTSWASSVKFLLYAAGTWVKGTSDVLTLDTLYDSVLLGQNDFTALFTEEGYFVAKAGVDSRLVTVGVSPTGVTNIGAEIAANGTAA